MVGDKITSLAGLRKWVSDRIQLIEDVAAGQQRQPFQDEYDEIGVLKLFLEKISEFEAGVRERINELEKAEEANFYDVHIDEVRELRRILGKGGEKHE